VGNSDRDNVVAQPSADGNSTTEGGHSTGTVNTDTETSAGGDSTGSDTTGGDSTGGDSTGGDSTAIVNTDIQPSGGLKRCLRGLSYKITKTQLFCSSDK